MSAEQNQTQPAAQAGSPGEAAGVGPAVGGVRSSDDLNWLDLWALNPETRSWLSAARRDAACSHASSRRKGAGDGSQEITTPEKLRHLQDTLYHKAKAEPDYRFWSLYGELSRRDLLEHALRLVARNGGAPGADGESLAGLDQELSGGPSRDELQRILSEKVFKIILTSRPRGTLPAPVWRSSYVIYFDEL